MVRRSRSSAPPPPNHNLEVTGIHTAISLHDFRDASLKTPPNPDHHLNCAIKITLRNANCIHKGQNTVIRMTITRMIILIVHFCPHVHYRVHTHGPKYHNLNDGNSNAHSNCAFLPSCENPHLTCLHQTVVYADVKSKLADRDSALVIDITLSRPRV